jgi:hypothetical protein
LYGGSWAWWPGPVVAYPAYYPIWAPAYVSFFGFGRGFGVGFGFGGFGSIGWLPLGPGDWCHPWWGRWGGRERFGAFGREGFHDGFHDGFRPLGERIRGRQFSNVRDAATNSRIRGGMTTMAGNRFGREAVGGNHQSVSAGQFRQASMVAGKMGVAPTRGSYSASNRAASPSTIRNGSTNSQHFFSASRTNAANHTQSPRNGSGTTARPSASARPQSSGGLNHSQSNSNVVRGGNGAASQSSRPSSRGFTPPASSANNRGSANSSNQRGFTAPPSSRGPSPSAGNPGGFRSFGPPARSSQPSGANRGFAPPSSASRGGGFSRNSGRPQLNMHRPIVTPRGGSRYGGYRGGSGSAARSGGASSHPSGGGSHGGGSHKGGR